jgi:hypothetical protein
MRGFRLQAGAHAFEIRLGFENAGLPRGGSIQSALFLQLYDQESCIFSPNEQIDRAVLGDLFERLGVVLNGGDGLVVDFLDDVSHPHTGLVPRAAVQDVDHDYAG